MMNGGMLGFGFGYIWMLLFWIGLIVLAVWLIRTLFPTIGQRANNDPEVSPSAQEILKVRYAQGEITTAEYQEMLQTIQQERTL